MGCCQLIFNELCLEPPAPSVAQARQRLHELRKLVQQAIRRTGAEGLRVVEDFDDLPLAPGYTFQRWQRDEAVDKDERRQLARQIDRGQVIDERDPPDVFAQWEDRGVDATWQGRSARGLFAAFLLDSLALSLAVEPWDAPQVEIGVLRLGNANDGEISVVVRHAAQPEHLEHHPASWLGRSTETLAVYRREVDPWRSQHVPASHYGHGKHVRGATNSERHRNAVASGNGQFLATLDHQTVTDPLIESWEREALAAPWQEPAGTRIERHGEGRTFYVDSRRRHPVGFAGGSGRESRRMRVEWSSGNVHSHPREEED